MPYKLMIIDDDISSREEVYKAVFASSEFELIIVRSPTHLDDIIETTPVDAYMVDVFLENGSWVEVNDAGHLFAERFHRLPRAAPVFLISVSWENNKMIPKLNMINQCRGVEVLRYLTWDEFTRASKKPIPNMDLAALRAKVLYDLAIWHEKSTFHVNDDESIRILILSDLQYGDPHTSTYSVLDEQWIGRALNQDSLLPHLVVLAGDIAYSGDPHEYQLARLTLDNNLFQFMWGKGQAEKMRDRIIVVPGNHDVNLRFSACNLFNWERNEKKWTKRTLPSIGGSTPAPTQSESECDYSLEPFLKFAHGITGSKAWEVHNKSSHVDRRFEQTGLRFHLFNSVSEMHTQNPTNADFSSKAISSMSRSLGNNDKPEDFFNIAISHHGIQIGNTKSVQMKDWETIGRQYFKKEEIRLWTFGHYHKAAFNLIEDGRLGLVQTPTLKIRPNESAPRGFTLVELIRSTKKVTNVNVHFYELGEIGIQGKTTKHLKIDE